MPPVPFDEFLKNPPKQETASCGHVLDVMDKEGNYKINGNVVCADCYFDALGDEVEKHPIGRPTPHGGCT